MMIDLSRGEIVILRSSYRESVIFVRVNEIFISKLQIFMRLQLIMIHVLK